MSTLLGSFVAAAFVVIAAFTAQSLLRRRMRDRLSGLELRPNCLLTRHPIGFIVGPRSLFSFFDRLSTDVPSYLREHGYEVFLLELPRDLASSALAITNSLDTMRERCHLIASEKYEAVLTRVASQGHPMIASLTLIENPKSERSDARKPTLADFKPLPTAIERFVIECKRDSFESRFLDLAISLAERDTINSD